MFLRIFNVTVLILAIGFGLWRFSPQQAGDYICDSAKAFRSATSQSAPQSANVWAEETASTLSWRFQNKVAESLAVLPVVPPDQQYAMLQALIQLDIKDPQWSCEEARLLLLEQPAQREPDSEAL